MPKSQATKIVQLIKAQTITDGATATANLDMKGYDYATIVVNCGDEETTDATLPVVSLLESDDTQVTNFATVVANASPDLLTARNVVRHVDMRGRKRYLRLSVTAGTGTGSNMQFAAVAIQSRAEQQPASTSDMVGSTHDAISII